MQGLAEKHLPLRVGGYKRPSGHSIKETDLKGREERSAISAGTMKASLQDPVSYFSLWNSFLFWGFLGLCFNFFKLGSKQVGFISWKEVLMPAFGVCILCLF